MAGQRGRLAEMPSIMQPSPHRAYTLKSNRSSKPGRLKWAAIHRPRHGHADAGGHALPERTGGGLDAAGPAVLRMAGATAVQLAKCFDRIQRDRRLAQRFVVLAHRPDSAQVEQRIEQHRGVADGKHEAVTVRPDRILRIEAQELLPQAVSHRRHRHGRARMAGVGCLHGVH